MLKLVLVSVLESYLFNSVMIREGQLRHLLILSGRRDAEISLKDHRVIATLHVDIVESSLLQNFLGNCFILTFPSGNISGADCFPVFLQRLQKLIFCLFVGLLHQLRILLSMFRHELS